MTEKFQIIEVSPEDAREPESLGTKEKFWFRHHRLGLCLYKKSRSNTAGEDWSEKIAAELCGLIKLPHAKYELATCNGEYGIISRWRSLCLVLTHTTWRKPPGRASLTETHAEETSAMGGSPAHCGGFSRSSGESFLPENGNLILGNEILARIYPDYPKDTRDLSHHPIARIFGAFDRLEADNSEISLPLNWEPLENILKVQHTFIGYLLLDAWIGNGNRHHENWGFIELEQKLYLAPTYDHASSLGRNIIMTKLFLSWQEPKSHRWYPIGCLEFDGKEYHFFYINGVKKAREEGFRAVHSLPDLENFYSSAHLFPLFSNRLMTALSAKSGKM